VLLVPIAFPANGKVLERLFQYPNRYTTLHVACTSTFYAHFHHNCTRTKGKYNLSYCKTNCNCWVWNQSVWFCTLWEL